MIRIVVTSVLVDDQERALKFYTEVLGFEKKADVPMGHHRWLTVVSKSNRNGVELLLEPDEHPAAKPFKESLVADGIPFTSFGVDDVRAEHDRLCKLGVHFTQPPVHMGSVTTAVLDDTCGNLIQIAQKHGPAHDDENRTAFVRRRRDKPDKPGGGRAPGRDGV